jgi:hypothetical protein
MRRECIYEVASILINRAYYQYSLIFQRMCNFNASLCRTGRWGSSKGRMDGKNGRNDMDGDNVDYGMQANNVDYGMETNAGLQEDLQQNRANSELGLQGDGELGGALAQDDVGTGWNSGIDGSSNQNTNQNSQQKRRGAHTMKASMKDDHILNASNTSRMAGGGGTALSSMASGMSSHRFSSSSLLTKRIDFRIQKHELLWLLVTKKHYREAREWAKWNRISDFCVVLEEVTNLVVDFINGVWWGVLVERLLLWRKCYILFETYPKTKVKYGLKLAYSTTIKVIYDTYPKTKVM